MGKKHKFRFGRAVLRVLTVLVLLAASYAALILLTKTPEKPSDAQPTEPVTALQPGSTSDIQTLTRLFGAPLPVLPGAALQGSAENVQYEGQTVRKVTMTYSGFQVTAVRPADAAPLLLRPELSLEIRDGIAVAQWEATLAHRGTAWCLYFSDENAAYAVFVPNTDEQTMMQLAGKMTAVD